MNIKRTILSTAAVAALCLTMNPGECSAQQPESAFEQKVIDGFNNMYEKGFAEKLYLHTDKPYYSAGENIYIKGYVVNAITHQPISQSNFIYVQMINSKDEPVQQFKIMRDSAGVFRSQIELPASFPAGKYTLKGFTRWMQNFGEEYFYTADIEIGNTIDDAVNCDISYEPQSDGTVKTTVTLLNSRFEPLQKCNFRYKTTIGSKSKEKYVVTDASGKFDFDFEPDDSNKPLIEIESQDEDYPFKRTFDIPLFGNDFDVQFFPEGGALLPGQLQLIAFKAIGTDGLGTDITGSIYSDDGEKIADISSSHLGMGTVSMIAEKGCKYYAEVSDGRAVKRFDLPQTAESGCAVKLLRPKDKIAFQVLATEDMNLADMAALIHCRGKIAYASEDVTRPVILPATLFDDGISHLIIIDKNSGRALSQRLFFINNGQRANTSLIKDKQKYGKREKASLILKVTDKEGNPVQGDFSVAVTDRHKVRQDSCRSNILTSLLLTSDLKGYIQQPGYYFAAHSAERAGHLDMVMLTHGWTRFDIQALLDGELPDNDIQVEEYQSISGSVIGFTGKELKNSKVVVMEPEYKLVRLGYHEEFNLGETGKFRINGIPLTEGKRLVVQAFDKRGWKKGLELRLDNEILPQPKSNVPPTMFHKPTSSDISEEYLQSSKEKYYNDGGMRVVDVEGVTVRAKKIEQSRSRLYNMTPTYSRNTQELTQFGARDVYTALITFPGVTVNTDGTAIYIRGGKIPALVLLDDMEVDMSRDMFAGINIDDVEFIDVISGADAAIFGGRGDGGVVNIKLKEGVRPKKDALPSVGIIYNLGVRLPKEFYQPKYDVPEVLRDGKPDIRTTLAWIPSIRTNQNGVAQIDFYTADYPATYDIIIEGVSDEGLVCHSEDMIYRE